MKIKTRLLISFLVLALVPLVAVGVVFVALARNNAKDEVLRQLESVRPGLLNGTDAAQRAQ